MLGYPAVNDCSFVWLNIHLVAMILSIVLRIRISDLSSNVSSGFQWTSTCESAWDCPPLTWGTVQTMPSSFYDETNSYQYLESIGVLPRDLHIHLGGLDGGLWADCCERSCDMQQPVARDCIALSHIDPAVLVESLSMCLHAHDEKLAVLAWCTDPRRSSLLPSPLLTARTLSWLPQPQDFDGPDVFDFNSL